MRLYSHADCVSHQTPEGHPERSDRLAFLLAHLEQTGFTQDHPVLEASPIQDELVRQAHHPQLLERLRQSAPDKGLAPLDPDTWMGPASMAAALQAAGSVWQGVTDVAAGAETRVFCAVRPPGHHAEFDSPMGFCLLNSVAIAAINALNLPGVIFRPTSFKPRYAFGTGELLHGVQIHISDHAKVNPAQVASALSAELIRAAPEQDLFDALDNGNGQASMFLKALGDRSLAEKLARNEPVAFEGESSESLDAFRENRVKYLLYK